MRLKDGIKRIAIDFDGTITTLVPHPEIGELQPGVKRVMDLIKEAGGIISIWTCRGGSDEPKVKEFLEKHDIPYDYFNAASQCVLDEFNGQESPKIFADVYIDEKCILWLDKGDIDWDLIEDLLFIDDENWKIGDTIRAKEDCWGNFKKGDEFKIEVLRNDVICFGPVQSDLANAKRYFKKVK